MSVDKLQHEKDLFSILCAVPWVVMLFFILVITFTTTRCIIAVVVLPLWFLLSSHGYALSLYNTSVLFSNRSKSLHLSRMYVSYSVLYNELVLHVKSVATYYPSGDLILVQHWLQNSVNVKLILAECSNALLYVNIRCLCWADICPVFVTFSQYWPNVGSHISTSPILMAFSTYFW